jgi:hypothetical protein
MGKFLYWLVNRFLCFQFCDILKNNLSLHQFGIVVKGALQGHGE